MSEMRLVKWSPTFNSRKRKKRRLACTGRDGRQLEGDGGGGEGGKEGQKKNKSLKALYGILPMNGNETCMTALHYATLKQKEKKENAFIISKSTS